MQALSQSTSNSKPSALMRSFGNFRETLGNLHCCLRKGFRVRAMIRQQNRIYEFGPFRLVVAERLLLRDGETIPLQPKAFDLLLVLVQNHGHLMEKDELLKVVWPDAIVEEVNLANNISILRRALSETRQQFIKTVPKRGYRFVMSVKETVSLSGSREAVIEGRREPSTDRVHVGREQERAQLYEGFASAAAGKGLLLCVAGEPGIGKTTLVEDFLGELGSSNQPCLIAHGRCSERLAGTASYLPWLEVLDGLLRSTDQTAQGETAAFITEFVAQAMRRLAPTWYALVVPPGLDDSLKPLPSERAASQERMKHELGALLRTISNE